MHADFLLLRCLGGSPMAPSLPAQASTPAQSSRTTLSRQRQRQRFGLCGYFTTILGFVKTQGLFFVRRWQAAWFTR